MTTVRALRLRYRSQSTRCVLFGPLAAAPQHSTLKNRAKSFTERMMQAERNTNETKRACWLPELESSQGMLLQAPPPACLNRIRITMLPALDADAHMLRLLPALVHCRCRVRAARHVAAPAAGLLRDRTDLPYSQTCRHWCDSAQSSKRHAPAPSQRRWRDTAARSFASGQLAPELHGSRLGSQGEEARMAPNDTHTAVWSRLGITPADKGCRPCTQMSSGCGMVRTPAMLSMKTLSRPSSQVCQLSPACL